MSFFLAAKQSSSITGHYSAGQLAITMVSFSPPSTDSKGRNCSKSSSVYRGKLECAPEVARVRGTYNQDADAVRSCYAKKRLFSELMCLFRLVLKLS